MRYAIALVLLAILGGCGWMAHHAAMKKDSQELFVAIREGDDKTLETCLADGGSLDDVGSNGLTPLMAAVLHRRHGMVRTLIARGANVNSTGVDQFASETALHIAADMGDYDSAQILIGKGSNVNSKGKMDTTPLMLAIRGLHVDVAKLLVESGADPSARDARGFTAIDFAKSNRRKYVSDVFKPIKEPKSGAAAGK